MKKQLVYDLPTRFFHWIFAGLFLTAFVIAKVVDDDSVWFNYHSIAGLVLGFLVILRIVWGFVGSKHARFSNFALKPIELIKYFKGIISGSKKRWTGHNPASSWAGIAMMVMGLCLAITGYLMTSGINKETFEDAHEVIAYGFIITAVLHVLGIIFHTIRHKEIIGLSMIDGKKTDVNADQTIPSSKSIFGILLVSLVISFSIYLLKNYNSQTRSLNFFGTSLQLGENEKAESNEDKD